jgi:hypothetical protein
MNLKLLSAPFPENEIEWRIGSCGKKKNGDLWATCLAYVQARAIMNRLDEVCGPENWKPEYQFISKMDGMKPGILCGLSIRVDKEWITKYDGAEQTDIEEFKGGLSSALKRAGVPWGIGRYLYNLDSGFAIINDSGEHFGKTKDETVFHWDHPKLPGWALPDKTNGTAAQSKVPGKAIAPIGVQSPETIQGPYRCPFGKKYGPVNGLPGMTMQEIAEKDGPDGIRSFVAFLEKSAAKDNKPVSAQGAEFILQAEKFLGILENNKNDDIQF